MKSRTLVLSIESSPEMYRLFITDPNSKYSHWVDLELGKEDEVLAKFAPFWIISYLLGEESVHFESLPHFCASPTSQDGQGKKNGGKVMVGDAERRDENV